MKLIDKIPTAFHAMGIVKMLPKIFNYLGIREEDVSYLGNGSNGIAFKVGEMVYKFTADKSEALIGLKLQNIKAKHLNRVHSVIRIPVTNPTEYGAKEYYLITQDFLKTFDVNATLSKSIEYVMRGFRTEKEYVINGDYERFLGWLDYFEVDDEGKKFADELIGIIKELRKYKIQSYDINFGNLGYKDGVLKYLDIGLGIVKNKTIKPTIDLSQNTLF